MSSKWAEGLTRWRPYVTEERTYDLSHLHPTRFTVHFEARSDYPARDVDIRIGYSSHPFTIRCPEDQVPHAAYSKNHDPRVFCPSRYELSLKLPELVGNLETRRCYATNQKNYFIVDALDGLPEGEEYWVFFSMRKADEPDALRVFVESAYSGDRIKAPYARRRESDMFRSLINRTLGLAAQRALQKQTPP